jgi:tetratricopeptide (TPR) repeat protein
MSLPTPTQWERVQPLLDRVLETPADEREPLLDTLSGGDAALRGELARLVGDCERGHPLLDRPATERFAALLDDDLCHAPPPSLAARYRISRVLGRGGMATVYLGQDLRHGRDVAVKVLRPVLAGASGHARFLREIEITARLRHPNIVPVFDSGEAEGLLYFVMPYEEGHSLRERLAAQAPLPLDEALEILIDVCEALSYAHRHGIAHLDIKPDNILLAGRHAMVADFGVARALTAAEGATPGAPPIGTPAYMAPEQGIPGALIDHRADLYALGIVAWEVLAGRVPFEAPSPRELLVLHRTQPPPPLTAVRAGLPPALSEVVSRCLAKHPADRWESAESVLGRLEALRRVVARAATAGASRRRWRAGAAAAAIATGAIALGALVARDTPSGVPFGDLEARAPAATPGVRQLFLVADLENGTTDPRLGPMVTELLRRQLAAMPHLAHVSRKDVVTTLRLMRRDSTTRLDANVVRDVAERLDVPMIVEGSIWAAGSSLLLSAQITETRSGNATHGARAVARDSSELMQAVDQLARGLGSGAAEPLEPPHTRFLRSATTSSAAALEQLRLGVEQRRIGNYLGAVAHHAEATRLDPAFASAWVALLSNRWRAGLPLLPAIPGLDRAQSRLDSLHPTEAMLVGWVRTLHVEGDAPRAIAGMQRYIDALMPLRGREQGFTGDIATWTARGDLRAAELVIQRTDSAFGWRSTANQMALVSILHAQGRRDEAKAALERMLAAYPGHSAALRQQVALMAGDGRYEEAHALAAQIPRQHTLINDLRVQGELDATQGRYDEAARHWQQLAGQALALGEGAAAVEYAAAAARLRHAIGDARATAELATVLERAAIDSLPAHQRPYLALAHFHAVTGDAREARRWLRRYEGEFPVAWRGPDRALAHRARAAVLAAEGNERAALEEWRAAVAAPVVRTLLIDDPDLPTAAHPELARVWERAGRPDSAIAVYERYLTAPSLERGAVDAFELGAAHERLASLLERRGDRAGAIAQLDALGDRWRDADPPLRARAERARLRAARLRASGAVPASP